MAMTGGVPGSLSVDRLGEGRVAVGIALRPLPVDVDLRQQQAACLRLDLERRLAPGLGLPDQRVVLDGVLVDLEQILGTRGALTRSAQAIALARTNLFLCIGGHRLAARAAQG